MGKHDAPIGAATDGQPPLSWRVRARLKALSDRIGAGRDWLLTRPPLVRLWRWLGFGTVAAPHWRRDPKYASDYLVTSVKIEFSWRERFMLLVSGRLHVAISTKTHPVVKRSVSKTAIGVLVPGER